jgi:hypothetical protein
LIFSTSPPVFAITSVAVSLGGCIISFIRATRRRK